MNGKRNVVDIGKPNGRNSDEAPARKPATAGAPRLPVGPRTPHSSIQHFIASNRGNNGNGKSNGNGHSNGRAGSNNNTPLLPNHAEGRDATISRSNGSSFRIMLADDHPLVREGLALLIDHQADMKVVAQATNGQEAVAQFLTHQPDIGLIDLRMPIMDGIQVIEAIRQSLPEARLVILSCFGSEEDIYRALRAGASGYALKDTPIGELVQGIRMVGQDQMWIPSGVAAKLAKRLGDQELTPRETQVLQKIAAGKSNKEIGTALDISEATVKVHVTHILEKLKASGRTEAINLAARRGLVRMDFIAAA